MMDIPRDRDVVVLGSGTLFVHPVTACSGTACCIHAPSAHRMVEWPMHWRGDRQFMERVCQHGIGHPDPDSLAYKARVYGGAYAEGVHGCDGCCAEDPPPIRVPAFVSHPQLLPGPE